MIQAHINEYLANFGHQLSNDSAIFTEIDSMQFIGLLSHLTQHGINADLGQFHLPMSASLRDFVQWLEPFSKEKS